MTNNEERIWIECELPLKKGMTDRRRLLTITRQEAIEKLAVGWCSADCSCEECSDGKKGSKRCLKWLKASGRFNEAENALNALLGVEK